MRVIAGTARGYPLRASKAPGLRPTSDLVRGAMFDMVGPFFSPEVSVLDLYAGTGALGIEALSRGAGRAEFVEQNPKVCAVLRENLERTGFTSKAKIHCRPVKQALPYLEGPFDLVLLDPPYAQPIDGTLMEDLVARGLVAPRGVVVIEHSHRSTVRPEYAALHLERERRHGDTIVSVFVAEGASIGQSRLSR